MVSNLIYPVKPIFKFETELIDILKKWISELIEHSILVGLVGLFGLTYILHSPKYDMCDSKRLCYMVIWNK